MHPYPMQILLMLSVSHNQAHLVDTTPAACVYWLCPFVSSCFTYRQIIKNRL